MREREEREGETVRVRLPPSLPIVIEVDVWVEEGERVSARGDPRAGVWGGLTGESST